MRLYNPFKYECPFVKQQKTYMKLKEAGLIPEVIAAIEQLKKGQPQTGRIKVKRA